MSNGEREKQEGIARVSRNADQRWVIAAKAAFVGCALKYDRFNSDHVWLLLDEREVPRPPEMRVMTRIVNWALKEEVIEPLVKGDIVEGIRPESHRANRQMYTTTEGIRARRAVAGTLT